VEGVILPPKIYNKISSGYMYKIVNKSNLEVGYSNVYSII
jgi:hypothetical protein